MQFYLKGQTNDSFVQDGDGRQEICESITASSKEEAIIEARRILEAKTKSCDSIFAQLLTPVWETRFVEEKPAVPAQEAKPAVPAHFAETNIDVLL